MSTRRLELVVALIRVLTKKEYNNLERHLLAYHVKNKSYVPKTVQLARFLRDTSHTYLYGEIKEILFQDKQEATFNQLINRLYSRAMESLVLSINTGNREIYSEAYEVRFDLRTKLSVVESFFIKGLHANAHKLLYFILSKSREFEIYDVYIEANYKLLIANAQLGNEEKIVSIQNEISTAQKIQQYILDARLVFNVDIANEEWELYGKNIDYINEKRVLFEKRILKVNSPTLCYWKNLIDVNYYEYLEDDETGLNLALEQLNLLESNKCLKTPFRLGIAYLHIAHNLMLQFQFEEAASCSKRSMELFGEKSVTNRQVGIEYLFQAYFHSRNYGEAYGLINKSLGDGSDRVITKRYAKRHYYRACIYFLRKQYKLCLRDLAETVVLDKDKRGWNLNIRILTILAQIELHEYAQAETNIENLYKRINLLEKSVDLVARYKLITQVLQKLRRFNFSYKDAQTALEPLLELLTSNDPAYKLRILKPELIDITRWYTSKISPHQIENVSVEFPK